MSRNSISRPQQALRFVAGAAAVGGFGALVRGRATSSSGNQVAKDSQAFDHEAADLQRAHDDELTSLRLEIAEAETERQRVIWRMNRAVEEERRRLASELHRRPLQELAGVGYQLERVSMALGRGDHDAAGEIIDEAAANLMQQLESIRMIMTNLRPPILDEHGLAGSLEGIKARLHRDHPDLELQLAGHRNRLGAETETAFYRVAQECLDNVVRHADATTISITIDADDEAAQLRIEDNGSGFDIETISSLDPVQLGIVSMQDRMAMIDGTIEFASSDAGTVVLCRAPRADLSAVFQNELET